jgi:hypothetical protein
MTWCERNRIGYVFGLAGNQVLLTRIAALAEDAAVSRVQGEAENVRRFGEFAYAAKTWSVERQVIARVEASPQGSDSRFIVTNLKGAPRWLYESVYCARGQAENLIKAHKLHLASDRTSRGEHENPVPGVIETVLAIGQTAHLTLRPDHDRRLPLHFSVPLHVARRNAVAPGVAATVSLLAEGIHLMPPAP